MGPSIKSGRVGASWKEGAALGLLVEILQRLSLKIPVSLSGLGGKERSEERTENSGSRFHADFSIWLFFKNQFTPVVGYVAVNSTSTLKALTGC